MNVDFQRIVKSESGLPCFNASAIDLSAFEKESVICQKDQVLSEIYRRRLDGALTVVKSISLNGRIELCQIETEIENLMNLRHPMIASLIGYVFLDESRGPRELKTVRLHTSEGTLSDILTAPPPWWTPTAKAKAVIGIALGLRFVHGHGLLHGAVKASNILFDADRRIQIADFSGIRLETGEVEPFSGENWSPQSDVSSFVSLLYEIVVGRPASLPATATGDSRLLAGVPEFVLRIIQDGGSLESKSHLSFIDIIKSLKANDFQIMADVDCQEVSGFVKWVESFEQSGKLE